jgi:hypothetical protein
METDPSLDGLLGATELACNLGDGSVMTDDLLDGTALNRWRIARLLFRHWWIWKVKGISI